MITSEKHEGYISVWARVRRTRLNYCHAKYLLIFLRALEPVSSVRNKSLEAVEENEDLAILLLSSKVQRIGMCYSTKDKYVIFYALSQCQPTGVNLIQLDQIKDSFTAELPHTCVWRNFGGIRCHKAN